MFSIPFLIQAAALLAIIILLLGICIWWIKQRVNAGVQLEREVRERLAAERKAAAHAAVSDVRNRNLGPVPGIVVRDVEKPIVGTIPGAGSNCDTRP